MAQEWKTIANEKEKYAAYLCRREWAEKREAVRERAGGKCERCQVLPIDACHHLTYERKYKEKLEDLQAICTPCHQFTHGKDDFDPAACNKWLRYLIDVKKKCELPLPEEGPLAEEGSVFLVAMDLYQSGIRFTKASGRYEHLGSTYLHAIKLLKPLTVTSCITWILHGTPSLNSQSYSRSLDLVGFGDE